jgi:transcriptional regulator CtsR
MNPLPKVEISEFAKLQHQDKTKIIEEIIKVIEAQQAEQARHENEKKLLDEKITDLENQKYDI